MNAAKPSGPSAGGADTETESSFPPELLRAVLVATFGSLLLNLNATSVNVALDSGTQPPIPFPTTQELPHELDPRGVVFLRRGVSRQCSSPSGEWANGTAVPEPFRQATRRRALLVAGECAVGHLQPRGGLRAAPARWGRSSCTIWPTRGRWLPVDCSSRSFPPATSAGSTAATSRSSGNARSSTTGQRPCVERLFASRGFGAARPTPEDALRVPSPSIPIASCPTPRGTCRPGLRPRQPEARRRTRSGTSG